MHGIPSPGSDPPVQFTRLRLNGFKSFVDPTDLVIARGLTGVVGPNGCGKSNLLEALRWVMGENRPTAMRGAGMEDVIFAGAATRPARNFAEVSLTVDNGERRAPAGFNDADHIEVTRRITRDAGSAFKCNAKEVRARDVQMLFADASTGSHSPALVRQGQISELINAKPKSRRRVLEEAAGISGLYQRRHEAELRLRATETNLDRVADVVDQLSGQLAQLARQAKQAARYRVIGAELRVAEGMLLYRRWREADEGLRDAKAEMLATARRAVQAEADSRAATAAREAAEEALPPLREEQAIAGALVQRLSVERDTLRDRAARAEDQIKTLEARAAQLSRDRAREDSLTQDAGETLSRLDWEQMELEKASEGHEERLAAAEEAATEAAAVLADHEETLIALTEEVARLAARHGAVERLLADTRKTLARSTQDADAACAAVEAARSAAESGEQAEAAAAEALSAATERLAVAEERLGAAEDARAQVQSDEADARAARSETEGEARALAAEVAALRRLVAREDGGGAQILDETRVAAGFERAFGAALGYDLRAPRAEDAGSGWVALPPYVAPNDLPDGVEPLAAHVDGADVLVRRLTQVGLVEPAQGPILQAELLPGQRLVSRAGDLWRWDGLRAAAEDAPSAAALRLEQINRLAELEAALEAAEARAEAAAGRHADLAAALAAAADADRAARAERRAADGALADANRAASKAEADRALAEGRVESAKLAVERHGEAAAAAQRALRDAETQAAALPDLGDSRAQVDNLRMAVEAARLTMLTRRSTQDEVKREGQARVARLQTIAKERALWADRLSTADARIAELDARISRCDADLATARAVPDEISDALDRVAARLGEADARCTAADDACAGADAALRAASTAERDAARAAADAREARARSETRAEAAEGAVSAALERMQDEAEATPETLLERLDVDPQTMPPVADLEALIQRLRRSRDALGAVNLRAEEDARAVQDEHDTLVREKQDLEAATAKLRSGIAALNREGRERLLTAFDQVNANFGTLFTHLFNGGEARLVLVESDDPLDAGLEIMCQPPGKKLSTLSLLSGGEQTLTALALIFAVFLANPAPICVLDEVDAPLDDANVTRFCDMLDEMTRRTDTRFLVITHHAVTMSRMDRLFGVTMAEQGVSQLVSVDLKRAEQMVA
jgi:chromosome segregation protein